jgi:UDP-N-acetyl-D-mannosaminuronic acid transferase (WecB/TagA/CpsF family)
MSGRKPGEEWYYRRTGEPTRWLKVVVHYVDGFGRIVTAFPRRRLP